MSVTFNFSGSGVEGLNVSNRNAETVCEMIGVPFDYGGDVDAQSVIANLSVADPVGHTRETTDNHGVEISSEGVRPVCRFIDYGVSQEQLSYYATAMLRLAIDALAAGERIFWG
jgi:hypothetical protein